MRAEILGAALRDDSAAGQNHDPVADKLDLTQQMRVEEDPDLAFAQLLEQCADGSPACRVERARRLVEQQHRWRPDERLRDPEPLLHPLGHRIDPHGAGAREPDELEQLSALAVAARRADESLVEAQDLVGRVPAWETEELGEVAERGTGGRRSRRRSADLRAAAGRANQPAGDLDEGRLPGPVRSEQAYELAGLHLQADPVERQDAPIALGGVLHEQGRDHRASLRAGHRRSVFRGSGGSAPLVSIR